METRTLEEINGKEAFDLLRGGLVLLLEKANQEEQTEYVKGMVSGLNASIDVVDLMLEKILNENRACVSREFSC